MSSPKYVQSMQRRYLSRLATQNLPISIASLYETQADVILYLELRGISEGNYGTD